MSRKRKKTAAGVKRQADDAVLAPTGHQRMSVCLSVCLSVLSARFFAALLALLLLSLPNEYSEWMR